MNKRRRFIAKRLRASRPLQPVIQRLIDHLVGPGLVRIALRGRPRLRRRRAAPQHDDAMSVEQGEQLLALARDLGGLFEPMHRSDRPVLTVDRLAAPIRAIRAELERRDDPPR